MGVFWSRYPGGEVIKRKGDWIETDLSCLSKKSDCFFVTSSDVNKVYLFETNDTSDAELSLFNEDVKEQTKSNYLNMIEKGVDFCEKHDSGKIVLSRRKCVAHKGLNIDDLFENLCLKYPKALVYVISSLEFGTWIGATPEIFIESDDNKLKTMALAGTLPNDDTEWSQKEFDEQKMVADYINSSLEELKVDYEMLPLESFSSGPVKHLRNVFEIHQSDGFQFSTFAKKMHPTPAVGGVPKQSALDQIRILEFASRDLYTGLIGQKSQRETKVYVNLRCARLFKDRLDVYVGGGITKDSIPEKEWKETEMKAETILSLI